LNNFDTFANKIDQYLINLSFFSALSSQRWLKLSPISADNSWDKIGQLCKLKLTDLRILRIGNPKH
jgi:hypothetical protein